MREVDLQDDRWMGRLDSLVAIQLNGEASDLESRELVDILESQPDAYQRYAEFVVDASYLRSLSEASMVCGVDSKSGVSGESRGIATQSGINSRKRTLYGYSLGAAVFALTACIVLALGIVPLEPQPTVSQSTSHEGDASESGVSGLPDGVSADAAGRGLAAAVGSEVATVLRADDVVWAKDNLGVEELSRLSTGETLHFTEGDLELIFDSSVRMRVRGPALLEIRSPIEVYSRFGVLSARVGEAGKGFVIETPNSRIEDLGTEFGVAVDQHGVTDVAVFRGAVDLTYGPYQSVLEPSLTRRLVQGQALTLSGDGTMKRLVSYDENRFPLFRNEPMVDRSREAIFTRVTDNIRDGISVKSYRIIPGGLHEDSLAYVDREHEWNGVDESGLPRILNGADFIMPFNQDKYLPDLRVDVTVARPARLFVFMSPVAHTPRWLSDNFEKTDMRIGLDESGSFTNAAGEPISRRGYRVARGPGQAIDTEFFVWQRDIVAPADVTLGSVRQARRGWGFCMYGIAAVPLEVARQYDMRAAK